MKKLVTHGSGFHADDVMAYAILKEVLSKRGETWSITRSRDPEIIESADIAFDIGDVYDPAKNRFDHHQRGRAGARENGVLYAAAGLIWKHFGRELCESDYVWDQIDRGLIQSIDARDNGQDMVKELNFEGVIYNPFGMYLYDFEPTPFEEAGPEVFLSRFEEASDFAQGVLVRKIHILNEYEKAFAEAKKVYDEAADKSVLIFDKNYDRITWRRFSEFPEPLFTVYFKKESNYWKVEAIVENEESMKSRCPAPESWCGLDIDQLREVSGVPDAVFCHPSGFLFGALSYEGAMKMIELSRAANSK